MKVLVTGGAGFIGSHITDELLKRGHDVTVIDDFSTGKEENLDPRASVIEAKIEEVSPRQFTDFEYVFHLAAKARIQPSIEFPLEFDRANTHGTLVALEIARACNAKFIYSSSSSIYGPRFTLPVVEEDKPNPQNPYALQKLFGEQYCALYEQLYGLRTTVFRYFNVFGERQLETGAYATMIGIFDRLKREGNPFTIVDDGNQRRDFTYVKDVVQANMLAMVLPVTDGQTYNVGTGKNTSVNEVACAIDRHWPVTKGIVRKSEVRLTLADSTELQKLGWQPSIDVITWIKTRPKV
jgi:UDP-glucose 4-epimerase